MQDQDFRAEKIALHFIEADTQCRAELVRVGHAIGHHCEIYSDLSEVAAHPPRSGIILVRDQVETGGVAIVMERLMSLGICLPVVAMDYKPAPCQIVEAIKDGALDFLVLPLQEERLERMIAKLRTEVNAVTIMREKVMVARNRLSALSGREREVLEELTGGGSNKEIARTLSISPRTVEIHRANMMHKLGARSAAEAIRIKLEAKEEPVAQLVQVY
jgi:FixJ family two-component response regulator